jgi:hypothetical protein
MFPLEKTPTSEAPVVPRMTDNIVLQIPSVGSHTENYVMYRIGKKFPPVLQKLVQRGVMVTGVEEETLQYSIRWVESKLRRANVNNQKGLNDG